MIRLKATQPWFLQKTAVYYRQIGGDYVVYKPAGITLASMGLAPDDLPRFLFIRPEDKAAALAEMHSGMSAYLTSNMADGRLDLVRDGLVDVVSSTFEDPRSGQLGGLSAVVGGVIKEFTGHPNVVRSLALMAFKDYSTALHSVNVMAFVVAFCLHHKMPEKEANRLGQGALLHDLGKTEVSQEILTAPRRLSEAEFREMRKHPQLGHQILLANQIRDEAAEQAVLQHHEKLDGSGYPKGIKNVSFIGQLVGMVDCYEALTSEERPYRSAMPPMEALSIIRDDAQQGRFSYKLFENFAKSLT